MAIDPTRYVAASASGAPDPQSQIDLDAARQAGAIAGAETGAAAGRAAGLEAGTEVAGAAGAAAGAAAGEIAGAQAGNIAGATAGAAAGTTSGTAAAQAVLAARTITGGGLATGGGTLDANRVITVTEATQGEAEAGTSGTVAMSPRRWLDAFNVRTTSVSRAVLLAASAEAARLLLDAPLFDTVAQAAAQTIPAAVGYVDTAALAVPTDEGAARYVRTSKAEIDSLGLPSQSYFRSVDRFMPNGSTDAVNGGYWVNADPIPSAFSFGVTRDTNADYVVQWQAFIDFCLLTRRPLIHDTQLISRTSDTLTLDLPTQGYPALGVMSGTSTNLSGLTVRYMGPRDRPAVQYLNPVPSGTYATHYFPNVYAFGNDGLIWPGTLDGDDVGIRTQNMQFARVYESHVYGFTKGVEHVGMRYTTVFGRHCEDNRYGRVWNTEGAIAEDSFHNQVLVLGGRIGMTSNSSALGDAYGDVVTWDKVASYRGFNNCRFEGVCYEMGATASATYRVPVWFDGVGGFNTWVGARFEFGKGPFAILDGAGGAYAHNNVFDVTFNSDGTANQVNAILEVNGACGNIMTGAGCATHSWASGALAPHANATGSGQLAYFAHPDMFLGNGSTTGQSRITEFGDAFVAHRDALVVENGQFVYVAVDVREIKQWRASYASVNGFYGRPRVVAFDADGVNLTGDATDPTWGDEPYIKGAVPGSSGQSLVATGNGYGTSGDAVSGRDLYLSVRPEVATMWFGVGGASTVAALRGLSLVGYQTRNTLDGNDLSPDGASGIGIIPVDDSGGSPLASATPGGGTVGYYARGRLIGNLAAASGQPSGWTATTAGWLAVAWAASTAYALPGRLVLNDSDKVYELLTPGTSAGSGGPTGTGTSIADGTCVWRYVGVKAVFSALAAVA